MDAKYAFEASLVAVQLRPMSMYQHVIILEP